MMRKHKSSSLQMGAVGTGAATAPAPLALVASPSRRRLPVKPMGVSLTSRTNRIRTKVASIDVARTNAAASVTHELSHASPALPAAAPDVTTTLPKASAKRGETAESKAAAAHEAKIARRDRVVLEHLPLVKAIAVRVHENLPVHVDMDDLVHAGILGLFDAASKYNPDKQVAFSSYAKHRIKGAILDSLRQLDWASRDMRRRHKQVEAATRDLASELKRNPTEAEVAQKLGVDQNRWRSMMLDLRNVGLISASTRSNDSEDLPAPDFPSKPETQPDSICAREQLRSVLGVAMQTLPERYQKVVSLYYTSEMTMKEIGTILGINESRVSQIHKAALEKMAVVLGSNGITSSQAF
jgi:RNA polymerase sigma factor for flagellar operon FliA